jgi:hypothetical protein
MMKRFFAFLSLAVLMAASAVATGSQPVTLINHLTYQLTLSVDGIKTCDAAPDDKCTVVVQEGVHIFEAVDGAGIVVATSEHEIGNDGVEQTWEVNRADD